MIARYSEETGRLRGNDDGAITGYAGVRGNDGGAMARYSGETGWLKVNYDGGMSGYAARS